MGSTVEANSLSTVTDIASNPPSHPNAPLETPQLPLTLYIARVPGSRDVFLTPLKPREKVVSAEDVQSSLYYVHVNSSEIDSLPSTPLNQLPSPHADVSEPQESHKSSIRRKPVLPRRPVSTSTPPYPVNDDYLPSLPPRPPAHFCGPKQTHISVLKVTTAIPPYGQEMIDLPVLPERPVSKRPVVQHGKSLSSNADDVNSSCHSELGDQQNSCLWNDTELQPVVASTVGSAECHTQGSLTLIRRDPSSAKQWNVASIYDPPVKEVSSLAIMHPSPTRKIKEGGAPLYLDITTPSYTQFSSDEAPAGSCSSNSTSTITSSVSNLPIESIFHRRLYMPGSRFGQHEYANRQRTRFGSIGSNSEMSQNDRSTSSMDRRSRSYTFFSPWNGQCEFSTSKTGRSLKCRHRLPSTIDPHETNMEVSELRFNLPNPSRSGPTVPFGGQRASSSESTHIRLRSTDSTTGDEVSTSPTFLIDENGRLDLHLGRERAGGGFGGKQAKLGKLIILPEGLKMLDLLVAANMGLWWRAYERT